MANISVLMVLFCLSNVITHLPYLTDAGSCKSNGHESPAINPSGTHAVLTLNNFGHGGDGGPPSECDGKFHPLPQRVVALSTGWYSNGRRCGRKIRIKARNGRSTVAKVVDECDSVCGKSHGQACKTNVVDASQTVWKDLGLNTDDGEVPVTWTMV
ncbi:putative ripening-related protein 2 [Spatholobus suberectus]|nr:putative ripening-related protein 2 [Spatholobus suberectus]